MLCCSLLNKLNDAHICRLHINAAAVQQQQSDLYTCNLSQVECMPAGATVSISESESMTAVLLRGLAALAAAVDSRSDAEALSPCRSFSKAAAAACRSALASSCRAMQYVKSFPQTGGWVGAEGGGGGFSKRHQQVFDFMQ